MKWPTIKLGEVADFKNGINYSAQQVGNGIPVYGVSNFQNETYAYYEGLDEVNSSVVREEDLIKENDILFVRSNGNRNLIGRSVFIRKVSEKITHSGFTIRCRFKSNLVYPRFYGYVFKTQLVKNVLIAQGGGTNINNLNQQILSNLEVPLPLLEEQKSISIFLEQFDRLIELNNQKIKTLQGIANRIYREWFVNYRYPFHAETRMIDTGHPELVKIPEGWSLKDFGDLANEMRKTVQPTDFSNYELYYGLEHISRKSFTLGKSGKLSEAISSKLAFEAGDTLFGKIRPYFHKVGFAETSGLCSSDTIVLRAKNNLDQSFIRMTAFSEKFVADASAASKGTKMPRADWSVMSKFIVAYPDKKTLEAFNSVINPITKLSHTLMRMNLKLESIRDILLPRLMAGEIDVKDFLHNPMVITTKLDPRESERTSL